MLRDLFFFLSGVVIGSVSMFLMVGPYVRLAIKKHINKFVEDFAVEQIKSSRNGNLH